METLAFKFDWPIYNLKNIRDSLSFSSYLHLTSNFSCFLRISFLNHLGERFSSSEFPTFGWELHLTLGCGDAIWLCQIGPDNTNTLVNTKYKIYAKQFPTLKLIAKF